MTTINERIWQRHAHPWSGWFEVVSYPLVYVPVAGAPHHGLERPADGGAPVVRCPRVLRGLIRTGHSGTAVRGRGDVGLPRP
jgi:hypothetical protein